MELASHFDKFRAFGKKNVSFHLAQLELIIYAILALRMWNNVVTMMQSIYLALLLFFNFATTLVNHLFIELMLQLFQVKQMYSRTIYLQALQRNRI